MFQSISKLCKTRKIFLKFFTKTFGSNCKNALSLYPLSGTNRGRNEKEEIFETLINNNKTVQKRAVNSDDGLRFLSTIKSWDIDKKKLLQ